MPLSPLCHKRRGHTVLYPEVLEPAVPQAVLMGAIVLPLKLKKKPYPEGTPGFSLLLIRFGALLAALTISRLGSVSGTVTFAGNCFSSTLWAGSGWLAMWVLGSQQA